MPRNRRDVDRDDKVAAIVAAATRQATAGGFGALSMAGIARELGVAQNAVYWYFPTRDHLFLAVLRQMVDDIVARKPPNFADVDKHAVWLVDRVAEVHPLIVAMRDRARVAPVVAEYERELDALIRRMVASAVGDDDVAVEAFLATAEGLLVRQVPRATRARVVRFTLERLRS